MWLYYLIDPRTQLVRYVGVTNNPKRRLTDHLKAKGNSRKAKWIRALRKIGMSPILICKAQLQNKVEAFSTEIRAIAILQSAGNDLVNGTSGGDGLLLTEEAAQRRRVISKKSIVSARLAMTKDCVVARNRKIAATRVLTDNGRQRLREIGQNNKGRIPWNKGKTGYTCQRKSTEL